MGAHRPPLAEQRLHPDCRRCAHSILIQGQLIVRVGLHHGGIHGLREAGRESRQTLSAIVSGKSQPKSEPVARRKPAVCRQGALLGGACRVALDHGP
jgi:hypothetical protein